MLKNYLVVVVRAIDFLCNNNLYIIFNFNIETYHYINPVYNGCNPVISTRI